MGEPSTGWRAWVPEGRDYALLAGLGLVVYGLWPTLDRAALVVPGAVLVWLVLRRPVVVSPPAVTPRRR